MEGKRQLDVAALYSALDAKRESLGMSWTQAAKDAGVGPALMTRLSQGKRPDADSLVTLTGWLGLSTDRFVVGEEPEAAPEATVEVISTYLRADRSLKPRSAAAIESVLRAAYEQLTERDANASTDNPRT